MPHYVYQLVGVTERQVQSPASCLIPWPWSTLVATLQPGLNGASAPAAGLARSSSGTDRGGGGSQLDGQASEVETPRPQPPSVVLAAACAAVAPAAAPPAPVGPTAAPRPEAQAAHVAALLARQALDRLVPLLRNKLAQLEEGAALGDANRWAVEAATLLCLSEEALARARALAPLPAETAGAGTAPPTQSVQLQLSSKHRRAAGSKRAAEAPAAPPQPQPAQSPTCPERRAGLA